jgi:NodT family efflux transporter outer membrane factor (OMF) lipoprotein
MTTGKGRAAGAAPLAIVAAAAALAACTVGPDYERPPVVTPAAYKEAQGWKPAAPQDAINRGAWWSVYRDPVLDGFEKEVDVSNQNLKVAEAAFRQASAIVNVARSAFFPSVTMSASAQRQGQGGGASGRGASAVTGFSGGGKSSASNVLNLTFNGTWDLDVWGRIRRTVESDVANAQASAADLASARLSAQSTLATAYMELRVADELKRLLDATADGYLRSLEIAGNRYSAGTAAKSDVAQAQTQYESTRAQAINVGVQRAQFEHAIAVLVGTAPADFAIQPTSFSSEVPVVPTGVPSILLERRPDIAGAERRMAAANAQIGVAISAYYPDITLSASYGLMSTDLSNLFTAASQIWSVGPQLAVTVLDFGARSAQVDAARASYDQSVAAYRQTVLVAFQQVEDELAALRVLEQQAEVQDRAVRAAQEAEQLILNQYKAGTVDYTSVVTAQAAALSNRVSALNIVQGRLLASVTLVQSLGGGWNSSELPVAETTFGATTGLQSSAP